MSSSTHRRHVSPFGHVTHEYLLPAKELPSDDRGSMGAWFDGILDAMPEQVSKVLAARWSALSSPCTRVLRDRLLQFTPYSIIRCNDKGYLRLYLPGDSANKFQDSFFLTSPIDEADASKRLVEMNFGGKVDFQEFLAVVGGLRESMPPLAGDFLNKEDWLTSEEIMYDDCPERDRWLGGIVIFKACNGDCVVLNRSGTAAWFMHEENRFGKPFGTFCDFLSAYVQHRVASSRPFDAYYDAG